MRILFFGSGEFGLPTMQMLQREHDIVRVISQPDRPAGRKRIPTPTPIAAWAEREQLSLVRPSNVNDPDIVAQLRADEVDAWVVIAFGQKLGVELLADRFAVNLHGSLLPRYRGAAPINWAMINGEVEAGVSVITLAQRMDAGEILAMASTPIDPRETAGELHDRLAELGPPAIASVLADHRDGTLQPIVQNEAEATRAPKFSKADGTVSFDGTALEVRQRVHGLNPWPGCSVTLCDERVRLGRVEEVDAAETPGSPGTILADGTIACGVGSIRILELQPPGGRMMSMTQYTNGRAVSEGGRCTAV